MVVTLRGQGFVRRFDASQQLPPWGIYPPQETLPMMWGEATLRQRLRDMGHAGLDRLDIGRSGPRWIRNPPLLSAVHPRPLLYSTLYGLHLAAAVEVTPRPLQESSPGLASGWYLRCRPPCRPAGA
ncbi:hypothetical protein Vafri_2955 [Volvox africanus]|uniref:Uncharacterized protein n=1 Tax=Volvox africanus TaxID=51714 RepID=A0A8J4AQH4_9CHLO|nr:hypothetical protein Vafri_2955 [Volvox africanus]